MEEKETGRVVKIFLTSEEGVRFQLRRAGTDDITGETETRSKVYLAAYGDRKEKNRRYEANKPKRRKSLQRKSPGRAKRRSRCVIKLAFGEEKEASPRTGGMGVVRG